MDEVGEALAAVGRGRAVGVLPVGYLSCGAHVAEAGAVAVVVAPLEDGLAQFVVPVGVGVVHGAFGESCGGGRVVGPDFAPGQLVAAHVGGGVGSRGCREKAHAWQ